MKWILGYIDNYDKIHYRVVGLNDSLDSHRQFWPFAHHNKWRWVPNKPKELNTYNEEIEPDFLEKIWKIIDDNR